MILDVLVDNMKRRFGLYANALNEAGVTGLASRMESNQNCPPNSWLHDETMKHRGRHLAEQLQNNVCGATTVGHGRDSGQALALSGTVQKVAESLLSPKLEDKDFEQTAVTGQARPIQDELAKACEVVGSQALIHKSGDFSGDVYVGTDQKNSDFLTKLLEYVDDFTSIRRGQERMTEVLAKLKHESQGLIQAVQDQFRAAPQKMLTLMQKLARLRSNADDNNNEDIMRTLIDWVSSDHSLPLALTLPEMEPT